jgi:hypothetical protein
MAFICFRVRGCASGSALAAAVIVLSSFALGITTEERLDTLDIVFHLKPSGSAQADDPARFATVYKGHVVKDLGLRRERNHAQLVVFETVIDPHKRSFPIEFTRHRQRHAVFFSVHCIFDWIKRDSHALM